MSFLDGRFILGSDYLEDILWWVKQDEERPRLRHNKNSPQIAKRGNLIEWSRNVSEQLGLATATFHLAVKLIDLFMDGHDIMDPQLYLVALGGLLLAAKMEEKDGNIPRCTKLNSYVNNCFPLTDFYSIELVMLNYFDWKINLPTSCYFASAMLPYAILETDRLASGRILSFSKAHAYLEEYVFYFLSVSVSEMSFIDKLPSVIGASVIAASRRAFGIVETWPFRLERLSGYSWGKLNLIVQRLLFLLRQSSNSSQDEGYSSCSGSPTNSSLQMISNEEMYFQY